MLLHSEAHHSRRAAAAAQLEHHVDRAAGLDVVELERLVVRELLARVDQADLVDLDALFLLQLALDLQHLVGGLEGHGLLAARQRLDEDLRGRAACKALACVPRVILSLVRAARDPLSLSLSARPDALARRAFSEQLCGLLQLLPRRRAALRLAPDLTRLDAAGGPACHRASAAASLASQSPFESVATID